MSAPSMGPDGNYTSNRHGVGVQGPMKNSFADMGTSPKTSAGGGWLAGGGQSQQVYNGVGYRGNSGNGQSLGAGSRILNQSVVAGGDGRQSNVSNSNMSAFPTA